MFFAAVIVKKVDSSIAWYRKVFDLKLRDSTYNDQRGFKQVNLHNDRVFFELIELKKGLDKNQFLTDQFKGYSIQGLRKIGFTVNDLDAWHKRLEALNVRFLGNTVTDRVSNKRTFLVLDPDENLIQFFEE